MAIIVVLTEAILAIVPFSKAYVGTYLSVRCYGSK